MKSFKNSNENNPLLTLDSIHRPLRILRMQIPHSLAHHKPQLDLIVHVYALGTQHGASTWKQDGGWGLEEEEGLLGGCGGELFDVVGVVAADAHDLRDVSGGEMGRCCGTWGLGVWDVE